MTNFDELEAVEREINAFAQSANRREQWLIEIIRAQQRIIADLAVRMISEFPDVNELRSF